jgi:hypothetical protein
MNSPDVEGEVSLMNYGADVHQASGGGDVAEVIVRVHIDSP